MIIQQTRYIQNKSCLSLGFPFESGLGRGRGDIHVCMPPPPEYANELKKTFLFTINYQKQYFYNNNICLLFKILYIISLCNLIKKLCTFIYHVLVLSLHKFNSPFPGNTKVQVLTCVFLLNSINQFKTLHCRVRQTGFIHILTLTTNAMKFAK